MSSQPIKNSQKKRNSSRRRLFLIMVLISVCVLLGIAGGATLAILPGDNRIAHGVRIAGVELGGMTPRKARESIEQTLAHNDAQITLHAGPREQSVTLAELGIAPDVNALAIRAYQVGRTGSFFTIAAQLLRAHLHGITLPPAYFIDITRADSVLHDLAHRVNLPPADATAHWNDAAGKLVTTPGHNGAKLDVPESMKLIKRMVADDLSAGRPAPNTLTLPYRTKVPHITTAMLAPVDSILASFTTAYASTTDRGSNIKTAAEAIDGTVLLPNEVFSFNKTVGPRSEDNGFLTAPVIIDGQLSEGTGGGVCQVSTTLYNAVLLADLQVTRRSHHSLPSHYVAAGRDATVSYHHIDFRFKNTSTAPIVIEAQPGARHLTVRILGKGPAPDVHIVTSDRKPQPGRTITKDDPTLPAGEKRIEKGTGGLSITVTRVVGDGPDAASQVISHDRYAGQPTIIYVGTGKAKEAAAADSAPAQTQPAAVAPGE